MCQRCSQMGHITSDIDKCAAYADPGTQNLVVFESKSNLLCNFYNDGEGFNMDDIHFLTAEHGYQYLKCKHLGCQEIAEEVLNAPTPGAAKKRANKVPESKQVECDHKTKNTTMLKVLYAKAEQCAPFRQALIETGDCIIMEGGRDQYWACGLDHRVAITTNVSFMPGDNQLGILLAAVRHSILKTIREYEQNDQDDDDDEDTESASELMDNVAPTSQVNQSSQQSEDKSQTTKATTPGESSGAGAEMIVFPVLVRVGPVLPVLVRIMMPVLPVLLFRPLVPVMLRLRPQQRCCPALVKINSANWNQQQLRVQMKHQAFKLV